MTIGRSTPSQVWRSRLPRFLKEGVAGAAEAMAEADGTYTKPLTVTRLMEHVFYNGPLSERTIRYQLRACEAVGLLVVIDPAASVGRYSPRGYRFNVAALATLDLTVAELRPPHRRKGAIQGGNTRGQHKGATDAERDVFKGGNQGGNTRGQQEIDPSCTDLHRTQAPALRAGPVENDSHDDEEFDAAIDGSMTGESPLPPWEVFNRAVQADARHADVRAERRDHPDDADAGSPERGRDHRPAPGAGLHLQQRPDLPGDGCGDGPRALVGPTQATFGPMDLTPTSEAHAQFMADLRARVAPPAEKLRRRRFG